MSLNSASNLPHRDLFPEESFQEHKIAGMNLKRFKRGGDGNSDELLKWIEEGCFDALSKKYLKSAVLTILSDTSSPNNVLETYTLRVNYPDSLLHQTIDTTAANIAQLSLTRNDQSVLAVESTPSNFKDAISKILRSLCVMSQTLKSLPVKKCLSMKLSYYEEVTPMGYEPPGFVAAEFDIDHLFQGATTKYSFGKAATPYHNIGLSMETVNDDSIRPSSKVPTTGAINSQALVFPESSKPSPAEDQNTFNVQEGMDFNESITIASQVAQAANSPANFPQSLPPPSVKPPETIAKTKSKSNFADLSETQQQIQLIKCTCGHNFKDLEMLQCNSCLNWQHSVCSGYVSCRDRRLENSLYICYYCRYGSQWHTFNFLQKLSQFRKALAVISAEGFETVVQLSKRLGISQFQGKNIRDRLVQEKFLISNGKFTFSIAKKDDYIKERIKFYFNQNLEIHPDFIKAQEKDSANGSGSNKRKSRDEEIESVDNANGNVTAMPTDKLVTPSSTVRKDIPVEINTMPFEVPDTDPVIQTKGPNPAFRTIHPKSTDPIPILQTPLSKPATAVSLKTPPDTILKKKRKISIPSSRISCYMNKD